MVIIALLLGISGRVLKYLFTRIGKQRNIHASAATIRRFKLAFTHNTFIAVPQPFAALHHPALCTRLLRWAHAGAI